MRGLPRTHSVTNLINVWKQLRKCIQTSSTLPLKKVWDAKDNNLFLKDSQCFTTDGYLAYWEAIDRTVRYFDSIFLKKCMKTKLAVDQKGQKDQKDRFRWQNPKFNIDGKMQTFRALPKPPS